jgi:hypothetical protein
MQVFSLSHSMVCLGGLAAGDLLGLRPIGWQAESSRMISREDPERNGETRQTASWRCPG